MILTSNTFKQEVMNNVTLPFTVFQNCVNGLCVCLSIDFVTDIIIIDTTNN